MSATLEPFLIFNKSHDAADLQILVTIWVFEDREVAGVRSACRAPDPVWVRLRLAVAQRPDGQHYQEKPRPLG